MRVVLLALIMQSIAFAASAAVEYEQNVFDHHTTIIRGLYDDISCERRPLSGVVAQIHYDDKSEMLDYIVVKQPTGTKRLVNIAIPPGMDQATSDAVYDGLRELAKIGRHLHGYTLACGAAGRVETLEEIE